MTDEERTAVDRYIRLLQEGVDTLRDETPLMTQQERRERIRRNARVAIKRCSDGVGGSPSAAYEVIGGPEGYRRLLRQAYGP